MKKRLLIVDSHALIHRAYHALPKLTTKKGELVNAVYGFLLVFFRAIKDLKPDYIAACFDLPTPTFRHKEFNGYKATRPKTPDELSEQIPKVKQVLDAFSVPVFEKQGFEADDLIGTLASRAAEVQSSKFILRQAQDDPERSRRVKVQSSQKEGIETIIVTGDLDLLQLVDEDIKVYALRKGVKDAVLYDRSKILERYGLPPALLPDYKALVGDVSDNIPGVSGIGAKTATDLLKKFGSLRKIYEHLENQKSKIKNQKYNSKVKSKNKEKIKPKVRELLEEYKEQAFLSKKLAMVRKDVPLDFDLKKCELRYDKKRVVAMLKEFEFESLMERLPERDSPEEKRGSGRLF